MFDYDWMKECRDSVGVNAFIESCYVDYCMDPSQSSLFNIYEAFFGACRATTGDRGAVCLWKGKLEFEECEGDKEWSTCGTECHDVESCWGTPPCDSQTRIEGCFCPGTTVSHQGQCITHDECPICDINSSELTCATGNQLEVYVPLCALEVLGTDPASLVVGGESVNHEPGSPCLG